MSRPKLVILVLRCLWKNGHSKFSRKQPTSPPAGTVAFIVVFTRSPHRHCLGVQEPRSPPKYNSRQVQLLIAVLGNRLDAKAHLRHSRQVQFPHAAHANRGLFRLYLTIVLVPRISAFDHVCLTSDKVLITVLIKEKTK